MNGIVRLVLIVIALALVGGGVLLASWDIPSPAQTIEKTLPDDQFPR
jgi:hypothetical protein